VARLLDLDRPVALLLVAVLHFMIEEDQPEAAVAELRDRLAPGSLVVLTHASTEGSPVAEQATKVVDDVYTKATSPLVMRSRTQVQRFFDGFELVEPGLVAMPNWRPESPPEQEDPVVFGGYAGVGRKA
jgi:hypothetical protein